MNFGQIIMKYRRALGLTQEGLAQKLGVTNQAVSKWESDQSCPDVALLPTIADLFGITLDQLFGREPKELPVREELPWPEDDTLRVVVYQGRELVKAHPAAREIRFCYEGRVQNIDSAVNVICDSVMGNVTAGGDVTCDDVYGHVQAGGHVNCDEVQGNVAAQGSVNCDDVAGSIHAMGNVSCDCVEGEIRAGGNVECDEASGNITAGGSVYCDHWEK